MPRSSLPTKSDTFRASAALQVTAAMASCLVSRSGGTCFLPEVAATTEASGSSGATSGQSLPKDTATPASTIDLNAYDLPTPALSSPSFSSIAPTSSAMCRGLTTAWAPKEAIRSRAWRPDVCCACSILSPPPPPPPPPLLRPESREMVSSTARSPMACMATCSPARLAAPIRDARASLSSWILSPTLPSDPRYGSVISAVSEPSDPS
mmetsp:Transcript_10550/g.37448  ORF Transcript_10550/g.37448 Transcript_10550/m.37448 type:complete len:208 (-) Transcript_10550:1002-1625(-)